MMLTHSHFEHLDLDIIAHVPAHVQWVVPVGVGSLLKRRGVPPAKVHEFDWWDERALTVPVRVRDETGALRDAQRSLGVAAVPASHWSGRTGLDTNRSLWSSYAVRCTSAGDDSSLAPAKLFFCGDSGYSAALFTAIGRMYGPFDVASIPIGSYEPRWHLSLQHMDPGGSVRTARDIGARESFAMHWGTWCMSGA